MGGSKISPEDRAVEIDSVTNTQLRIGLFCCNLSQWCILDPEGRGSVKIHFRSNPSFQLGSSSYAHAQYKLAKKQPITTSATSGGRQTD